MVILKRSGGVDINGTVEKYELKASIFPFDLYLPVRIFIPCDSNLGSLLNHWWYNPFRGCVDRFFRNNNNSGAALPRAEAFVKCVAGYRDSFLYFAPRGWLKRSRNDILPLEIDASHRDSSRGNRAYAAA